MTTWLLIVLTLACLLVGMTYGRWTPGGCCGCDECVIQSGFESSQWTGAGWTFNGSDATGSGFAYTSGEASAATAQARYRIGSPITSGQSVRVCIQVTDSDNYFYTEVEYATATTVTIRLGSRTSGSDSTLASTTVTANAEGGELSICYTDGVLMGWLDYHDLTSTQTAKSGRKAGVSASSSETLEAFVFANRDGDCPVCYERQGPCTVCIDGAVPRYLSFTISGVSDTYPQSCKTEFDCLGFGADDGCEAMSGTWILQHSSLCAYSAAAGQTLTCYANSTCFAGTPYTPFIKSAIINNDGSYGIQLNIEATATALPDVQQIHYEWRSGSTDGMDCLSAFAGKTLSTKSIGSPLYCSYPSTVTCNGAA